MKVISLRKQDATKPSITTVTKSKVRIVTSKGTIVLSKSAICYLKSDSNYCEAHTVDGKMICCSVTMKSIHQKIAQSCFVRPHASYVINVHFISSVNSAFSEITLDNGKKIPISRSRKAKIKAEMDRWFD